jgi:hypothetical protein
VKTWQIFKLKLLGRLSGRSSSVDDPDRAWHRPSINLSHYPAHLVINPVQSCEFYRGR